MGNSNFFFIGINVFFVLTYASTLKSNLSSGFFHEKRHFIYLNYLAELAGGEITKSEEMTEYIWIAPEKTKMPKPAKAINTITSIV